MATRGMALWFPSPRDRAWGSRRGSGRHLQDSHGRRLDRVNARGEIAVVAADIPVVAADNPLS